MPATWNQPAGRFFPSTVLATSAAPTVRYFGSYAAEARLPKVHASAPGNPFDATLNLSGLSFSFA